MHGASDYALYGSALAQVGGMNTRKAVGVMLIVIGLISLLVGGISWNRQKTIVDIGPLKAETTERKTLPIPPIIGGLALLGGVVLLVAPARRRI